MPMKQESPSLPRNLALGTFGKLLIVFSAKVNLLYLLYNDLQVFYYASDKATLFAKIFSKNFSTCVPFHGVIQKNFLGGGSTKSAITTVIKHP